MINIKGSNDHARKAFSDTTASAQKMSQDVEALSKGMSKLGEIPGINIMVQQFEKAKGLMGSLGSMGAGTWPEWASVWWRRVSALPSPR